MAASATFALKAGVWFRRGRRCMVSPDSLGTACPPSGRNSTYRPVQISGASSHHQLTTNFKGPTKEDANAFVFNPHMLLGNHACRRRARGGHRLEEGR